MAVNAGSDLTIDADQPTARNQRQRNHDTQATRRAQKPSPKRHLSLTFPRGCTARRTMGWSSPPMQAPQRRFSPTWSIRRRVCQIARSNIGWRRINVLGLGNTNAIQWWRSDCGWRAGRPGGRLDHTHLGYHTRRTKDSAGGVRQLPYCNCSNHIRAGDSSRQSRGKRRRHAGSSPFTPAVRGSARGVSTSMAAGPERPTQNRATMERVRTN